MVDERPYVVGHEPGVDRAIDVGGASVPLKVDRDDPMALGQGGEDRLEHLARAEPAVQQDQRPPGAVALVVQANAVDVGVCAGLLHYGWPVLGQRHPPLGRRLVK